MLRNPERSFELYGVKEDPEQFVAGLQRGEHSNIKKEASHQPQIYGWFIQRWLAFLQAFIDTNHS